MGSPSKESLTDTYEKILSELPRTPLEPTIFEDGGGIHVHSEFSPQHNWSSTSSSSSSGSSSGSSPERSSEPEEFRRKDDDEDAALTLLVDSESTSESETPEENSQLGIEYRPLNSDYSDFDQHEDDPNRTLLMPLTILNKPFPKYSDDEPDSNLWSELKSISSLVDSSDNEPEPMINPKRLQPDVHSRPGEITNVDDDMRDLIQKIHDLCQKKYLEDLKMVKERCYSKQECSADYIVDFVEFVSRIQNYFDMSSNFTVIDDFTLDSLRQELYEWTDRPSPSSLFVRESLIVRKCIEAITKMIELECSFVNTKRMQIFVSGATGVGKSSLINDIVWPDNELNPKRNGIRQYPLEAGLRPTAVTNFLFRVSFHPTQFSFGIRFDDSNTSAYDLEFFVKQFHQTFPKIQLQNLHGDFTRDILFLSCENLLDCVQRFRKIFDQIKNFLSNDREKIKEIYLQGPFTGFCGIEDIEILDSPGLMDDLSEIEKERISKTISRSSAILLCTPRREEVVHMIKNFLIRYLVSEDPSANNEDMNPDRSVDVLDCIPTVVPVVMNSLNDEEPTVISNKLKCEEGSLNNDNNFIDDDDDDENYIAARIRALGLGDAQEARVEDDAFSEEYVRRNGRGKFANVMEDISSNLFMMYWYRNENEQNQANCSDLHRTRSIPTSKEQWNAFRVKSRKPLIAYLSRKVGSIIWKYFRRISSKLHFCGSNQNSRLPENQYKIVYENIFLKKPRQDALLRPENFLKDYSIFDYDNADLDCDAASFDKFNVMMKVEIERICESESYINESQKLKRITDTLCGSITDSSPVTVYGIFSQYMEQVKHYIDKVFMIWNAASSSQRKKTAKKNAEVEEIIEEFGEANEKRNLLRRYRGKYKDIEEAIMQELDSKIFQRLPNLFSTPDLAERFPYSDVFSTMIETFSTILDERIFKPLKNDLEEYRTDVISCYPLDEKEVEELNRMTQAELHRKAEHLANELLENNIFNDAEALREWLQPSKKDEESRQSLEENNLTLDPEKNIENICEKIKTMLHFMKYHEEKPPEEINEIDFAESMDAIRFISVRIKDYLQSQTQHNLRSVRVDLNVVSGQILSSNAHYPIPTMTPSQISQMAEYLKMPARISSNNRSNMGDWDYSWILEHKPYVPIMDLKFKGNSVEQDNTIKIHFELDDDQREVVTVMQTEKAKDFIKTQIDLIQKQKGVSIYPLFIIATDNRTSSSEVATCNFDGLNYIRFIVVPRDRENNCDFYLRQANTVVLEFESLEDPDIVLETIKQYAASLQLPRYWVLQGSIETFREFNKYLLASVRCSAARGLWSTQQIADNLQDRVLEKLKKSLGDFFFSCANLLRIRKLLTLDLDIIATKLDEVDELKNIFHEKKEKASLDDVNEIARRVIQIIIEIFESLVDGFKLVKNFSVFRNRVGSNVDYLTICTETQESSWEEEMKIIKSVTKNANALIRSLVASGNFHQISISWSQSANGIFYGEAPIHCKVQENNNAFAFQNCVLHLDPCLRDTHFLEKGIVQAIFHLVWRESPNEPLSNRKIAEELKRYGYQLSDDVVEQYRKMLKIPMAEQRKGMTLEQKYKNLEQYYARKCMTVHNFRSIASGRNSITFFNSRRVRKVNSRTKVSSLRDDMEVDESDDDLPRPATGKRPKNVSPLRKRPASPEQHPSSKSRKVSSPKGSKPRRKK